MVARETRVWTGTGWASIAVPSGVPGKNAYELAVENGFSGTFEEWYASMQGAQGPAGSGGPQGPQGPQGIGTPAGGTTDQVLVKNTGADYDYSWQTVEGISGYDPADIDGNIVIPDGEVTGGIKTTYLNYISNFIYNVHTFPYNFGTTDTLQVDTPFIGTLLVVAGGAGGGGKQEQGGLGGGGGAGGMYYGDYAFGTGAHNLVVGVGGNGGAAGAWWNGGMSNGFAGENTTFDDLTMYGGGGGGWTGRSGWGNGAGSNGGSGGGGGGPGSAGGTGVLGQGRDGGTNGRGGGYAAAGNDGGYGLLSTITGSPITYGEGGLPGVNVTEPNGTGNGGNGAGNNGSGPSAGYKGSDGVVIVRYRIQ